MTMDERDEQRIVELRHRMETYERATADALAEIKQIRDRMRQRGYRNKDKAP